MAGTMTQDPRPPVAPIEGCYAVLRNGDILRLRGDWHSRSCLIGRYYDDLGACSHANTGEWLRQYDIIAIVSPELMAAMADGGVGELLAALRNRRDIDTFSPRPIDELSREIEIKSRRVWKALDAFDGV